MILLLIFFLSGRFAEAASSGMTTLEEDVQAILQEDADRMNPAAVRLAEAVDPSTYALIQAAVENRLFRYETYPLTLTGQGYEVLYPQVKTWDGVPLSPEDLIRVSLSRPARLAFSKVIPYINLKAEDSGKRIAAYTQLAALRDSSALAAVQSAVSKETDPQVLAAGSYALHVLQLFAGNEADQAQALDYWEDSRPPETGSLLQEYLLRPGISAPSLSRAEKILKAIEWTDRITSVGQNLFSGLSLGSILFLVALGLSIIYGLAGIINMSHGEFIMIGAYTTYCMQQFFQNYLPTSWFYLSFFLSLPVSFIVTGLVGLILERCVIRHLYGRPQESLLATWGISLILIQIARNIFGDLTSVKSPAILSGGWEIMDGLVLPYNRLFIMGLSALMFLIIYLVFQKSRLGIKIRAVTQNRTMSACVGISTARIDALTFVIGSGLAGIAGCAITLIGNVVPNMGQTYIVDSFLVVVIGGVGKLVGCVVSGLGIGVLSKVFEFGFEAVYGKVLMLVLIILFLQYKPKGLFPDKGRIGDD